MSEKKRRGFTRVQVSQVLEIQGKCCAKCYASLDVTGFHRDHIDGDKNNNATSNLQLLCPECHRAKKGKKDEHLEVQKDVMENLRLMIQKGLNDELAGAKMERIHDGIVTLLKTSYKVNRVPEGIEYPIVKDDQIRALYETGRYTAAYSEGFKNGINVGIMIAKNITLERVEPNYVE